ncbi:MAG: GxxExxY protein [Rhodospirillales bacterium]|nr:GxxExxY protein [Rhodospirillales bacterium]MCB9995097.1 GxxExxY protein [Rhodospirillales bacterium]
MSAAKKLNDITGTIVDASLKVHKAMGPGLYEKVYEDCLSHELEKRNVSFKRQQPVTVEYEDLVIPAAFKMDLLVEDAVIVELKSTEKLQPIHDSQILTYMRLSGTKTGLLINFNVPLIKDGIKRFKI